MSERTARIADVSDSSASAKSGSRAAARGVLPRIMLAMVGLACAGRAQAEQVTCKCVADTWVSVPGGEAAYANHGADERLIISGRVSLALLQFDLSAARGMTVQKATLRVHRAPAKVPLHTVGLSTISGSVAWGEGKQQAGRAKLGAANFYFARAGQQAWAYRGSDVTDVTFGLGGSLYAYLRARDVGQGWYEIDVPPALVHALMVGDQFGWLLSDEKGQTWTRHQISSRESSSPPVLILEGNRSDQTPPGAVRSLRAGGDVIRSRPADAQALGRTTLRPGSVVLRFGRAGDDGGQGVATRYELRYATRPIDQANFELATPVPRWCLDPLAPKGHPLATANALADEVTAVVEQLRPGQVYYFAARAIDEAGNAGPVSPLGRYEAYARSFPPLPARPAGGGLKHAQQAAAAGEIRIWAVPELLKINPQTGELLEADGYSRHRTANRIWDAATSTVKLIGARNEFVAFQLAIESSRALKDLQVKVSRPIFADCKLPGIFKRTGAIQLYREWFVPDDQPAELPRERRAWYPDALIPLQGQFDLPAEDNAVGGQTVQPIFVDIYIPHDAQPGQHTAGLEVVGPDGLDQTIRVEVEVLPLTLPDKLNFVVDLNCYGGVNSGYDIARGTDEYRRLEWAYHRLAHLHRTNLDVLGYGQSGNTQPDHAPPLEGEGAETKVASWQDWDAHFGPLLDGSAFADLPRSGVPITNMYLPFHENWPGNIHKHYKFDYPMPKTQQEYQQVVTRHALEAAPIEEAFTKQYQDRFSAVARQFAEHIRQRGWTKTKYLAYFNNKYYWKRPRQGGRGSSWWLLDEPNHRDDVRAISFFGYLLKRQLGAYRDVPIILRTDISRVFWIRDLLAGQIDLNCISRRFFDKNRYLLDNRDRFGRTYWNYASTNHPRETNVTMRAWCWKVWLLGGDGLLPWNAVRGGLRAWDQAERLTVFYVGKRFGKNEPFPSLRLKAYRRGQQDVEYLIMLAGKHGWDRDAVTQAVSRALKLPSTVEVSFPEDAGAIRFQRLDDGELEQVRLRVARALLEP